MPSTENVNSNVVKYLQSFSNKMIRVEIPEALQVLELKGKVRN